MHILVTNDDGVTAPGIAFSLAGDDLSETFFFDAAAGIAARCNSGRGRGRMCRKRSQP